MKKSKIYKVIYFLIVAIILINYKDLPNLTTKIHYDLEYVKCGSVDYIPRPLPQLVTIVYTLLTVGTPIILIIFSIITLVKANSSGKAEDIDKAKTNLFKKFIVAAIIFFAGAVVQFVLLRVTSTYDDTKTLTSCLKCFLYYSSSTCENSVVYEGEDNVRKKTGYTSNYINSNVKQRSNRNRNGSSGSSNVYTGSSDVILVGDSRTAQMCGYRDGAMHSGEKCRDYISVAQGGRNAIWFKEEAVPAVSIIVNGNPTKKYNIVILMGANDVGDKPTNEDNSVGIYKNLLPKLATETWKGNNITFVKLPCGDKEMAKKHRMTISQPQIDSFNSQMKSFIESQNISNLRYCEIEDVPREYLSDGVHYKIEGTNFYYEQIKSKCV